MPICAAFAAAASDPRPGVSVRRAAVPRPEVEPDPVEARSVRQPRPGQRRIDRISPRVAMWCGPSRQLMCRLPPPVLGVGAGPARPCARRVAAGGGWERQAAGRDGDRTERSGRARPSARTQPGAPLVRGRAGCGRRRGAGRVVAARRGVAQSGRPGAGSCCRAVVGRELRQRVGLPSLGGPIGSFAGELRGGTGPARLGRAGRSDGLRRVAAQVGMGLATAPVGRSRQWSTCGESPLGYLASELRATPRSVWAHRAKMGIC